LDGFSLVFNLLTSFLFPLIFLTSWQNKKNNKTYLCCLLLIECFLFGVFLTLDLFIFYIFFELILLPMLILILGWGSRARKIKASFYFFFYTFFGSFLMLLALISLYFSIGSLNILYLINLKWDLDSELFFWFLFFITFAIKIPMFPFYIWLPEAHVEAPTIGSVILAGLLLKLGSFGFLRILLPLFPQSCYYFTPLIFFLGFLGIFYSSIILLSQIDLKRIIAYSSIAHMNYAVLGLFTQSLEGIQGSVFLMLSHGFTSSGLFLLVGFLYDRFHTRLLFYYNGINQIMPLFYLFFFFFTFSNFGFPGLVNFIGEFLILLNILNLSFIFLFLLFFSLFYSLIYSMLLFNRIFLGELKLYNLQFFNYCDLTFMEIFAILPLFLLLIIFGVFPTSLFLLFSPNCFFFFI
jgi:NADH-quinone oxidoreductase subunit M